MLSRFALILLVFIAVVSSCGPQIMAKTQRVTLTERIKAGQSFTAVEQLQMEVQIEVEENVLKLKSTSGLGYRYTVKKVKPEGGRTIGLAIYSLYNENPGGLGYNTTFDSTDPLALPQIANLFTVCLVGQELEVEIGPDGSVGNVTFSKRFLNWLLQCAKKNKTPLTKEQFKEQVAQALDGQFSHAENSLEKGIFPDRPVAVGDFWEKEVKLDNSGFKMSLQTTYTLKQRLNGIALIEVTAKVLGIEVESGDQTYQFCNMGGRLRGTMAVMEACGWIRDFDLQFTVDGELRLGSDTGHTEGTALAPQKTGADRSAVNALTAPVMEDVSQTDESDTQIKGKFHIAASLNRKPW
ncbi:MAG: DUF6263 family protein [Bacillota bacterium]|jgi:hypothetical protein